MALTLPKLSPPKFTVDRKKLPAIVGGVIVLAAAAWFGWQYFMEAPPPPPAPKPQAVRPVKPKAAAPVDPAKARDQLVAEVVATTGMDQQLRRLPQNLVEGIRQSGAQNKKASPEILKAIEDAVAGSFTADGFRLAVDAGLKKNFDEKRMRALLKAYATPEGRAMVKQERAAPSAEESAQAKRGANAGRPSPKREELIKRIDAATRAGDLAIEVAFLSMKALGEGAAGAGAGKAAAVEKAIEKRREAATREIRAATLRNLAASFKDASDADLEKYALLHESENAKWFYGLVYSAVTEEAQRASAAAGARFAELAPRPAPKPRRTVSRAHGDARGCLALAGNTAIIKCAEKYR
jgi:hypothetical protein